MSNKNYGFALREDPAIAVNPEGIEVDGREEYKIVYKSGGKTLYLECLQRFLADSIYSNRITFRTPVTWQPPDSNVVISEDETELIKDHLREVMELWESQVFFEEAPRIEIQNLPPNNPLRLLAEGRLWAD